MRLNKKIKKSIVLQHDHSDCGAACLTSIIQFYGGYKGIDETRELSGTTIEGTSLLGLYQAANSIGFKAEGGEADIQYLTENKDPAILHVLKNNQLEHYVVYYGIQKGKYIIGDPANRSISLYSRTELDKIWKSKRLLSLVPTDKFITKKNYRSKKKDWFLKIINDDINILLISALIGMLISVLSMTMAFFTQVLIDKLIPQTDINKIFTGIAFLSFLLILRSILDYLRGFLLTKQSFLFNNRIINAFYSSILNLSKSFYDTRRTGDFIARLNDSIRVQNAISQIIGNIIIDLLVLLVSIFFLFYFFSIIGIVAICFIPLYLFFVLINNKKIIKNQKQVMESYALSECHYIDTIDGISEIKEANKQQLFFESNKSIYGSFQKSIFNLGILKINLGLIYNIIGIIFLVTILSIGTYNILQKNLTLGIFMAVIGVGSSLIPIINSIAMSFLQINEAKVAFERMFEYSNKALYKNQNQNKTLNFESLKIENMSFRYPGRSKLLHNINLEVNKGEIVAIAGESGCGKSTLRQIIEKFNHYEDGEIIVNHTEPIDKVNSNDWFKITGVVPQNVHIFNGSFIFNICLDNSKEKMNEAENFLYSKGFNQYFNSLPQSYMTLIGENGLKLSGGEKQLLGLARALFSNPQLLVLDEVTSSMDRSKIKFTINLLKELKNNSGIIFISHQLHLLPSFIDKIYLLEKGTICNAGTHNELIQSDNFYSNYWRELGEIDVKVSTEKFL